jgi:hypothetical protein
MIPEKESINAGIKRIEPSRDLFSCEILNTSGNEYQQFVTSRLKQSHGQMGIATLPEHVVAWGSKLETVSVSIAKRATVIRSRYLSNGVIGCRNSASHRMGRQEGPKSDETA